MLSRRTLLSLMGATALLSVLPLASGQATERLAFDRAAFDAAVKSGKPVLVDIYAPWCLTCRAQSRALDALFQNPQYAGFKVFVVDYDSEKDIMRTFNARQRSTLIAFSGGKEVGRVVSNTQQATIQALLDSAIGG